MESLNSTLRWEHLPRRIVFVTVLNPLGEPYLPWHRANPCVGYTDVMIHVGRLSDPMRAFSVIRISRQRNWIRQATLPGPSPWGTPQDMEP